MERRVSHRATAKHDVLARVAGTLVELTLLDLSVSGCKAQCKALSIKVGSPLSLALSPDETVHGEIVWADRGLVGIRFSRNLTLETLMQTVRKGTGRLQDEWFVRDTFGRCLPGPSPKRVMRTKPRDNRSDPRLEFKCRVELRLGYERDAKATIYNLSTGGCLVRHGFDLLAVDDRVNVTLPEFESFSGSVRWKNGRKAGIGFLRPLHPAVVELIIRRHLATPSFTATEESPPPGAFATRALV